MSDINQQIGMRSLDALSADHLRGKTIFIRCDFNVPLVATEKVITVLLMILGCVAFWIPLLKKFMYLPKEIVGLS